MVGKHPAERRQQDPAMCLEAQPPDPAAKDRQLVAKHENLELLGSIATTEEHDELEQATDDDVQGPHKQRQPPADGARRRYSRPIGPALHLIEYLHPTRFCRWVSGTQWRLGHWAIVVVERCG